MTYYVKMISFIPGIILFFWTILYIAWANPQEDSSKKLKSPPDQKKSAYKIPKLPEGPLGEVILLGQKLVENTSSDPLSKNYVGNSLNCTSCHLKNGTDPRAATFIGVATAYPAWSPRENRVITLEDRILNCFMRSCNGIRPPLGSRPSVAIASYITWLSEDQKIKQNAKTSQGPFAIPKLKIKSNKIDLSLGKKLYLTKCASCHAKNGSGRNDNPPVWGNQSYNDGAGLANTPKLAAWLKVAMPLDEPTLTEEESLAIAAYVNSNPRPRFVLSDHLPPPDKIGEYNFDPSKSKK